MVPPQSDVLGQDESVVKTYAVAEVATSEVVS